MTTETLLSAPSSGGRLVATDGRTLPLRATELNTSADGGLSRARLVQRFENPHGDPLAVTCELTLPDEGAVPGGTRGG